MDTETEKLARMVKSLLEAFETIPDPRGKSGKRHFLPAILALATAAMLSGARSLIEQGCLSGSQRLCSSGHGGFKKYRYRFIP